MEAPEIKYNRLAYLVTKYLDAETVAFKTKAPKDFAIVNEYRKKIKLLISPVETTQGKLEWWAR